MLIISIKLQTFQLSGNYYFLQESELDSPDINTMINVVPAVHQASDRQPVCQIGVMILV